MAVSDNFIYVPNPAHKWGTSEAGPPVWNPDKEKCPDDISMPERTRLLEESLAVDGGDESPRRYAIRRAGDRIEFFETKSTGLHPSGRIEIHGHPTRRVPPPILRRMRDDGILTRAEYNKFRKSLT